MSFEGGRLAVRLSSTYTISLKQLLYKYRPTGMKVGAKLNAKVVRFIADFSNCESSTIKAKK